MLFNSVEFAVFLPIVFLLYWFVFNRNLSVQNAFVLAVSYVFYGWWDVRFLSLIFFSSFVDFLVGVKLAEAETGKKRNFLLGLSIATNLGFLAFFKYFNFFAASFADAFTLLGKPFDPFQLQIILPIGISFYTFQTLSYSLDIYKKKIQPTRDPIAFFAFVSFFPQLVAGPIERASNLLPQFLKKRNFNESLAIDGLRQMLWGLFKKIVIADNCAIYVNQVFANHEAYSGSSLLLGAILFAFQIYCDFSGYSDIAIGTARLFGFQLRKNFAFPYFSRDIAEFWRRWHISLSSWFKDYLYIPLGGSRGGRNKTIRNVFIIFVVSGFWHGANWTFLAWGFLHALFFIPLLITQKNRSHLEEIAQDRLLPTLKEFTQILFTFLLTTLAWVFFRASDIGMAFDYINSIFSPSLFTMVQGISPTLLIAVFFIGILLLVEWWNRKREHGLEIRRIKQKWLRWGIYYTLVLVIIKFGGVQQEFIYFQF